MPGPAFTKTVSSEYAKGVTSVEFSHEGHAEDDAVVVFTTYTEANVVGASSVTYGGDAVELKESNIRNTAPIPGNQVFFLTGCKGGTQTLKLTKNTNCIMVVVVITLRGGGAVTFGDAEGGSSAASSSPAVGLMTVASEGITLAIVTGGQDDLPTGRSGTLVAQQDRGTDVWDLQEVRHAGEGTSNPSWTFAESQPNARTGIVLLGTEPAEEGETVEFGASISSASSLSASLVPTRLFGAAISGASAVSASLVPTRLFAASITAASELIAALTTSTPGKEPQPFDPTYRPPLELDVEIETAEGTIFRLSAEDLNASNVPTGIAFTTQRGDGFGTASFTLARSILKDYPDLSLLDTVRFVGRQGDVAYEGRIHSFPRTNDPMHLINVSCVGWMTYLKSRPCAPLIIDRRLGGWGEPTLERQAKILAGGGAPGAIQHAAGAQEAGTERGPGILFTTQRVRGNTVVDRGEVWFYAGGQKIGALKAKFFGPGSSVNWFDVATVSSDDLQTESDASEDLNGVSGDVTVEATGDRYWASFVVAYTGEGVTDPFVKEHAWTYPRVIGDHGLTARGTSPEEGYYLTDIGKYVTETDYPKIDVSEVEDNTFVLTQFTRHDSPTDGYEIWQSLNDLVLWELNMWEGRKLHFHPSDLSTYDWVLRTDDPGVSINWQGDSIENFANGVPVSYTDFAGITRTLWPDEHSELRDDSEDNPASRHGETLWAPIQTVPWKCLEPEALQWGRAYLAEYNRPKRPGSYRVQGGYLRDGAGHWRQGWQARNSDTLGVLDHPQDFPRIITQTSWTQDGTALDITVDALPWTLSAIAARHELALQSRNLSG